MADCPSLSLRLFASPFLPLYCHHSPCIFSSSLCAVYTKQSIRFLLSRSLHLHCSFPPSLSSLPSLHRLYSHSTSASFFLPTLFSAYFAHYEFHYHYYFNFMQVYLKHMCHSWEHSSGVDTMISHGKQTTVLLLLCMGSTTASLTFPWISLDRYSNC